MTNVVNDRQTQRVTLTVTGGMSSSQQLRANHVRDALRQAGIAVRELKDQGSTNLASRFGLFLSEPLTEVQKKDLERVLRGARATTVTIG